MKKTNNLVIMIVGIAQVILGIWLIFANIDLVSALFKVLGIAFLVSGLIQIISSVLTNKIIEYGQSTVILGALSSIVGIILITKSELIIGITTVIIALWLMINGIIQMSSSVMLKNLGIKYWPVVTILGAVVTVLGYLLIFAENNVIATMLNVYIGISLAISGASTIVTAFSSNVVKVKIEDIEK